MVIGSQVPIIHHLSNQTIWSSCYWEDKFIPYYNVVWYSKCGLAFFTCIPIQWLDLLLSVKKLFWKSWSRHLFYFYFKRESKTKKKTLKKWLHSFWKNVSLKNPSLGPGIRLPIRNVPLKSSSLLSPTKVSTT